VTASRRSFITRGETLFQFVGPDRLRHGCGLTAAGAARQHEGDDDEKYEREAGKGYQCCAGGDGEIADDEKDVRHGLLVADSSANTNE
jgi:hypothetical protein